MDIVIIISTIIIIIITISHLFFRYVVLTIFSTELQKDKPKVAFLVFAVMWVSFC